MLSHKQIWDAIDLLAARTGQTASGLARRSDLDPTTFNKSKRVSKEGRLRWPNTESISKILASTGYTVPQFMQLIGEASRDDGPCGNVVPLLGFAQAGDGGFFDDGGYPQGEAWGEVGFPDLDDENAYALEIQGESMMPLYRDGDIIVVSPAASVRRGDRVVVRTVGGEVMAKELVRNSSLGVELDSLNPEHGPRNIPASDVNWIARIVWASQ